MLKRIAVLILVAVALLTTSGVVSADEVWTSSNVTAHPKTVHVTSDWAQEDDKDLVVGSSLVFMLYFNTFVGNNTTSISGQAVIQVLGDGVEPSDVALEREITGNGEEFWWSLSSLGDNTYLIRAFTMGPGPDQVAIKLRATFHTPGTYQFAVWFIDDSSEG